MKKFAVEMMRIKLGFELMRKIPTIYPIGWVTAHQIASVFLEKHVDYNNMRFLSDKILSEFTLKDTCNEEEVVRDFWGHYQQIVIQIMTPWSAPRRLQAPLSLSSIIIPDKKTAEGTLVRASTEVWLEIVSRLKGDWNEAFKIPPHKWEEIIAGAFDRAKFDEVILTPRSGDHGRDVIAIRKGVGCVKIIGSVKAYKSGHLVDYDDVRALLGVLSGEQNASKAILTTTSAFPPRILADPFIAPFLPTRLELLNGEQLQRWLIELAKT
jgi:restriction system protein